MQVVRPILESLDSYHSSPLYAAALWQDSLLVGKTVGGKSVS